MLLFEVDRTYGFPREKKDYPADTLIMSKEVAIAHEEQSSGQYTTPFVENAALERK